MKTVRIFGYVFLRAFASLQRRPLIALLTTFVMTISMLLVGVAHLAERNVRDLSERWGSGVQMIVYLEEGVPKEHADKMSAALLQLDAVESATYIPSEEAMQHLESALGKHDELLEGIEASFLPASIEVRLMEGVRDLVSAHPVVERLQATYGVEEVEFLGNWVDDFSALVNRVRRVGLWLVLLSGLIGIFTVIATMRLSADSRAAELRVLTLIGAPVMLRRGPNLIEGVLLGLAGSCVSLLILWYAFYSASPLITSALSTSLGKIDLQFLSLKDLGQLILYGITLGAIGGLITNYSQARR